MLLGIWRNVQELEETLNLDELNAILNAGRDRDMRHWKFQASLKGIKLDGEEEELETGEEALERIKRRAMLKAQGITDEAAVSREVDRQEILDVGLDFIEG